jgi:hypothetical protein
MPTESNTGNVLVIKVSLQKVCFSFKSSVSTCFMLLFGISSLSSVLGKHFCADLTATFPKTYSAK